MDITNNRKSAENGTAQGLCTQRHNHQLVAGREGQHGVSETLMTHESLPCGSIYHLPQSSPLSTSYQNYRGGGVKEMNSPVQTAGSKMVIQSQETE